jgi:hypothetical protein
MSEWRTGPTTAVHWPIRARGHLRGEDAVRTSRDPGLRWSHLAAAWCCSAMLAGMRPRSLTGMVWPFAYAGCRRSAHEGMRYALAGRPLVRRVATPP